MAYFVLGTGREFVHIFKPLGQILRIYNHFAQIKESFLRHIFRDLNFRSSRTAMKSNTQERNKTKHNKTKLCFFDCPLNKGHMWPGGKGHSFNSLEVKTFCVFSGFIWTKKKKRTEMRQGMHSLFTPMAVIYWCHFSLNNPHRETILCSLLLPTEERKTMP